MKVEWNEYEVYPDGSQATWVDGTIYLGNKQYEFTIHDHTLEKAKKEDEFFHRHVTHAYEVSGLPYYIGADTFYKNGFESAYGYLSVGIDKNPGYEDKTSRNEYSGTPKLTIKDVENLVVKCFIEAFEFNYDEELNKFKENLDKRKALMEEAETYRKETNL